MIRELTNSEIKTIEDYIQIVFKDNAEYKNYFAGESKKKYADRGFLIGNNSYYIDVECINSINFVGMCKLQTVKDNFLTDIITLFERLYEEYGAIGIYRVETDERIKKIHEHIQRRYRKKGDLVYTASEKNITVTIIKKGGAENDLEK